ncbi:cytochrome c oxidase assembly factor CtaG [Bacillus testis]|uniref:cytochrome c oxidase assembly factor CtaG n=1 Tax=Bacillus testis TaxID=1622072 RepID=UPI000B1D9583|nr:cytochrome c oxidase assembly factor CtaG [Bacillus testis]
MLTLDIFGFRALWSPYFGCSLIIIGILYFLVTGKLRSSFKRDSEALTAKQAFLFITVLILLYALKGSPIDLLGHIMFSVHMTQMAVLFLVIPPMLIVAIPAWLWRSMINWKPIKGVFHFLTKPLIALFVFNATFSFYHIPAIFDSIKMNMVLHAGYTVLLFITSICMWWPIMNKLEEYQQFYGIKRIGYIFANGMLLTPACGLIIFAGHPMYETYSNPVHWMSAMKLCVPPDALANASITGPELFNTMPLLEDQRTGGVIMKIIQEIVFGIVLAQIFFSWAREERKSELDLNPVGKTDMMGSSTK